MQSLENAVYVPGHNSFFKSPDGSEDYISYRATAHPGDGERKGSPRIQQINGNDDRTPDLGVPLSTKTLVSIPL